MSLLRSMVWCALLASALSCGALLDSGDAGARDAGVDAGSSFHSTPAARYRSRTLSGWVVNVADDVESSTRGLEALTLLEQKLNAVASVLPTTALARVRMVPIWVSVADTICPAVCYNPSSEWLTEHGYEPLKSGGVEITSASRYVEWSATQPWMTLHELAHAYHHQVLSFTDADIKASYDAVVAAKTLESVPYLSASGTKRRHYALTDEREFFAEMSEAYFGQNDFWPFVRSELTSALPQVDALVGTKWGSK